MSEKDNNWYERGGLPQVGVECEMIHPGIARHGWQKVTIEAKFVDTEGFGRVVISNCNKAIWDEVMPVIRVDSELQFRPIKTEREKTIAAAAKIAEEHNKSGAKEFYGALYDAGLLRLPEEK